MVLRLVCVSLLFACTTAPAPRASPAAPSEPPPLGKLPPDVRPARYTLALEIDPGKPRFSGTAEIAIELDRPRTVIWLHGADLHVTSASAEAGERLDAAWEQVHPDGVAKLTLPRPIGPGKATLRFAWDAPFNQHLRGLYVSRADGRAYASTQFSEISARYAFPCFDEPRFKTPFAVTLSGPADGAIVSNMSAVEETAAAQGMKRVRFGPTPPLSTYLVLFAVGPWDEVRVTAPPNEVRSRPVTMRFFAPRGRAGELAFAASAAVPLLAGVERYFGTELPYEKLDHIVVPDYEQGAMENAGAITYRESFLLYREGVSHQWFGDSVTMRWWDEIWLNESFASWLSPRIVDAWDPTLDVGLDLFNKAAGAMGTDSLRTARRIRQPIENSGDINNAFDALTYWKGGALLGMFERFLGADAFRAGIRDYVAARRNGLGSTDELLEAVGRAAKRDVKAAFESFIDQAGVPLVEARISCEGGSARLELAQSRYLPLGSEASRDRVWQVPVCARYQASGQVRESCTLLTSPRGSMPLEGGCPDWLSPNAEGAGYYRWSLAPADLTKLRTAGYPKLHARERISLARALTAAVLSGTLPVADALAALPVLAHDENGEVAKEPVGLLGFVVQRIAADADQPAARRFAAELYAPVARRLGWQARAGEPQSTRRLREAALNFLARIAEEPEASAEAARHGRAYASGSGGTFDDKAVPPGLAGLALAMAVREGDAAFFGSLEQRLGKADDEATRGRIISALAATRDPALAERALALTFDPRLRVNERGGPIFSMIFDPAMRDFAWRWTKEHADRIAEAFGERGMSGFPAIGNTFCDAAHAQELKAVFEPRTAANPGIARSLANVVERMSLCAAQVQAQQPSAARFFQERSAAGREAR